MLLLLNLRPVVHTDANPDVELDTFLNATAPMARVDALAPRARIGANDPASRVFANDPTARVTDG